MEHNLADVAQYPGAPNSFDKPYIRLRTVLDALEANALHYILKDKNDGVRIERAKEIESLVMPILQLTGGLPNAGETEAALFAGGGCAEGFYNCGGVCVPYACPESTQQS